MTLQERVAELVAENEGLRTQLRLLNVPGSDLEAKYRFALLTILERVAKALEAR